MDNNRLALRQGGTPREAGGPGPTPSVVDDNEDEKVYYGFGVFMGLPLADLKAMKEDFVEQQQLAIDNGRGPGTVGRHALPPSAVHDGRTHRVGDVPDDERSYERITRHEDARMQQQQQMGQHVRMGGGAGGYPMGDRMPPQRQYDAVPQESGGPRRARYAEGLPRRDPGDGERGDGSNSDEGSDGSYSGHKSHSLNFILH